MSTNECKLKFERRNNIQKKSYLKLYLHEGREEEKTKQKTMNAKEKNGCKTEKNTKTWIVTNENYWKQQQQNKQNKKIYLRK